MTVAEVLVVGYEAPEGIPGWPVLAEVPPLLTVLRAGPRISGRSRVTRGSRSGGGRTATPSVSATRRLWRNSDDAARLFLEAWLERPVEKSERPGEGLPWDAPGFEPPGPPTGDRDK